MGSRQGMAAALVVLAALASVVHGEGYLGMPAVPNGYDWAAYTAKACTAPAYGTYGSVVPGTYDCPDCCQNVWGGYCQKKAMRYELALANNCPACSGETPCPAPRGCRGCNSGCSRLPQQGCAEAPLPAAPQPAAPLLPIPAQP